VSGVAVGGIVAVAVRVGVGGSGVLLGIGVFTGSGKLPETINGVVVGGSTWVGSCMPLCRPPSIKEMDAYAIIMIRAVSTTIKIFNLCTLFFNHIATIVQMD
jgi:hypothetical protein